MGVVSKGTFFFRKFSAHIEEIVQSDPSLPSIEIVEKYCGPHTRSHVFGFGGGVKAKDLKCGTSSKVELLSALRSIREENKSLNEENKSLHDRLSTLEDEMKEMKKIKELFAAQQSHVSPRTSPGSTEWPLFLFAGQVLKIEATRMQVWKIHKFIIILLGILCKT
ncbi:PREDICTED: uncharacterized protein LOC109213851 [Nicotiana attenuata]|uniref:Uncharacterized protein n=1 Tax=Nicotiana attenuata TaxID=49451 RepID=A0A1J6KBR5_NICAT|nr:PREDICTED: uncharacterized protein LOC109213851 [Nicotiana attenuata]XP_019233234.1 PREDICTED: uncharacterized protein LOC109213851 [Nicotiana attenuata]OIT27514.1 hypothetical protein A4A49_61711 [Nicotiana attenuata]